MTARQLIMKILSFTADDKGMLDREVIVHGEDGQIGIAHLYTIPDKDGVFYCHIDVMAGAAEAQEGGSSPEAEQ